MYINKLMYVCSLTHTWMDIQLYRLSIFLYAAPMDTSSFYTYSQIIVSLYIFSNYCHFIIFPHYCYCIYIHTLSLLSHKVCLSILTLSFLSLSFSWCSVAISSLQVSFRVWSLSCSCCLTSSSSSWSCTLCFLACFSDKRHSSKPSSTSRI